jgi:hypothetical protein
LCTAFNIKIFGKNSEITTFFDNLNNSLFIIIFIQDTHITNVFFSGVILNLNSLFTYLMDI